MVFNIYIKFYHQGITTSKVTPPLVLRSPKKSRMNRVNTQYFAL